MKRLITHLCDGSADGLRNAGLAQYSGGDFPDMDYQERYEPQGDRTFYKSRSEKEELSKHPIFADNRASRRPVEGTVARGTLMRGRWLYHRRRRQSCTSAAIR